MGRGRTEMDIKELIAMKLHEVKALPAGNGEIIRVPGGWIYRFFQSHQVVMADGVWSDNYIIDSVFVPLDFPDL